MKEFALIEAVFVILLMFAIGVINTVINAAIVTFIACIVTVPIVLIFPHWELSPWIHQHAFSLVAGVFLFLVIFPRRGVESPTVKLPARYRP